MKLITCTTMQMRYNVPGQDRYFDLLTVVYSLHNDEQSVSCVKHLATTLGLCIVVINPEPNLKVHWSVTVYRILPLLPLYLSGSHLRSTSSLSVIFCVSASWDDCILKLQQLFHVSVPRLRMRKTTVSIPGAFLSHLPASAYEFSLQLPCSIYSFWLLFFFLQPLYKFCTP